jgi:hypothetical protein
VNFSLFRSQDHCTFPVNSSVSAKGFKLPDRLDDRSKMLTGEFCTTQIIIPSDEFGLPVKKRKKNVIHPYQSRHAPSIAPLRAMNACHCPVADCRWLFFQQFIQSHPIFFEDLRENNHLRTGRLQRMLGELTWTVLPNRSARDTKAG